MFSGHQTTTKGITNINGVPIPAQPALLPTNQGDQRTATNWTSSQPTLTHQCTQPAMRSYQEGFLGATTAYNPTNMPTSSTTAFTHAGCRGPTATTHQIINRPPPHQHAVHQHAAHQNQPTYFPIPTNLGTAPTDHNHHQTISKTFRKSVPIVKPFIFDGETEQGLDWIGLFNATVNSTDMTNSEKMTHLQKLVSGDAKSLIRGYGCNGAMYNAALQRLENDFGNPTKIVTSFLRRLDTISGPNLRHTRSYKDLANFLQTMVDTFTTLGFQHDLHSTTNVQTVLSKLPTPCRLEWNRYNLQCNIRQPSLIDLTNWFNIYAEACGDLPSNSNNNNTRNSSSSNNYNSSNTQGSSSNGHTYQLGPSDHRASQNNRNQQRSQQQHKSGQKDQRRDFCPEKRNCQYLGKCQHFIAMNPKDRLQHARDLQLCFNCLSPHKFADC